MLSKWSILSYDFKFRKPELESSCNLDNDLPDLHVAVHPYGLLDVVWI